MDDLLEVEFYRVTFDPTISSLSLIISPPLISCTADRCSYWFDFTSLLANLTVTHLAVMISASNAVGESQPILCNPQPIGENIRESYVCIIL